MSSPRNFGNVVSQTDETEAAGTPRLGEDLAIVPSTPRIVTVATDVLTEQVFCVDVVRGPDWKWDDQDGGIGSKGKTVDRPAADGCIWVKWSNGTMNLYRIGAEGKFDLKRIAESEAPAADNEVKELFAIDEAPAYVKDEDKLQIISPCQREAAESGKIQETRKLRMVHLAILSFIIFLVLAIIASCSLMFALLHRSNIECRDDLDTLRAESNHRLNDLMSRLALVEKQLLELSVPVNRTAQELSNITSRMEAVEQDTFDADNIKNRVELLSKETDILSSDMVVMKGDIPGIKYSVRVNSDTLAEHANLIGAAPAPYTSFFAGVYKGITSDDSALTAFHTIYSPLLLGVRNALTLYLQNVSTGYVDLFTGVHTNGQLWKGEVSVYASFFSGPARQITAQQITPQILGESILAIAWILHAHQSYTLLEATPHYFPTGPMFENPAKFQNFVVGSSIDMLRLLADIAALAGHSLIMSYSLEVARQWFVLTKIRFEDHMQNPAILNYGMYAGARLGAEQFTLWRDRWEFYLPVNGIGYRYHPVQTMRACVAHYQWYIRVFEEEQYVFHSYTNNVPTSSLGYDSANVRSFTYDNPFTGQQEQKNMYWNLNGPTLATDFYVYRFDMSNEYPFSSVFDLPAKFADATTFRDMYIYLSSNSLWSDLAEVEFLYTTQLVPAAQRLSQLYLEKKREMLVDDDFPGLFRQLLPKAISHLDFTSKEVVNQDGTRISFADDRIIKMVKHHSANVGALLQTVPGDPFSYLQRIDDSKIYTSLDDILENYEIKSVATYEVDSEVILSNTKKTLPAAMFEGGVELVKLFQDLRNFIEEDAVAKNTYDPSFSTMSKSDWDVLGFYYGLHPSDSKFNIYNPSVAVSQARKDARANDFVTHTLSNGSTIHVPKFDLTLGIDYLFLEHYQTDPSTHLPKSGPTMISESEWKGYDIKFWCNPQLEEDRYLQRTFFMKMYEHQGAAWFKSLFHNHTLNGTSKPPQAPVLGVWDAEISELMATRTFLFTREKQFGSAASSTYFLQDDDVLNCAPTWYHKYMIPSVALPLVVGTAMLMQWVITGDPAKISSPKFYSGIWLHENLGHGMDHAIPSLLGYTAQSESWVAKGADVGGYYAFFYGPFTEGFATWFELFGHISGLYGTYLIDQGVYDFSTPDPYGAINAIDEIARLAARWICVASLHDVTVGRSFAWLTETWSQIQGFRFVNGWERTIYTPAQQASYASGLVSNLVAVNSVKKILRVNNQTFDARKFNRWRITVGKPYLGSALISAATSEALNFAT